MRLRLVIVVTVFLFVLGGCATTGHQAREAAAPDGRVVRPAKPSRAEIEARVAQELKELGEKELAAEEEAAAKGKPSYDIPITLNAQVERFIDYFQTKIPKRFRYWLTRSGRYLPLMRSILRQYGLPEDLVYLAMIESGFSCQAYSRAHAVGPWQFIRSTARRYGLKVNYWVDERRDPVKSTHAAARYLRDLYQEFGSWYLAAAAYNAGEAKIRRALKRYKADDFWDISTRRRRYLKRETKNYVPKMIAAAIIAKEPERYGFKNLKYDPPLRYDEVKVHPGTSLAVAAKLIKVKTSRIAELNPELRRWCTPPQGGMYTLRIPAGTRAAFQAAYAKLSPEKRRARIGTIKVRIQRGDTLGRIARTYRVPLRDLLALNPRLNPRRLRPGQIVLVPPPRGSRRLAHRRRRPAPVRVYAAGKGKRRIVHLVKPGDTIWDIAQTYGLNYRDIMRWNGKRSSRLKLGQKLVLYVSQAKAEAKLPPRRQTKAHFHLVKRGDTLWDIARAYGLDHRDIMRWNRMRSTRLSLGQKLILQPPKTSPRSSPAVKPAPKLQARANATRITTYVVRKGDNLWTISRRFNTTPATLRRLNGLTSNRITPGDRLTIPTGQKGG